MSELVSKNMSTTGLRTIIILKKTAKHILLLVIQIFVTDLSSSKYFE